MLANGTEGLADECHLRRLAAEFARDLIESGFGKRQRLGIAIEADQTSPRAKAADDLCRMAGKAECAVCNDATCAYIEKLNRIL